MPTKLSNNFTLDELVVTAHRDKDNTPTPAIVEVLTTTAAHMETVRHLLGDKVIIVTSGYRSPSLNALVGGVPGSAHIFGYAVDFNCYGFGDPLAVCREIEKSEIQYDQLIFESTWTHISFDPKMRREALTAQHGVYSAGLVG